MCALDSTRDETACLPNPNRQLEGEIVSAQFGRPLYSRSRDGWKLAGQFISTHYYFFVRRCTPGEATRLREAKKVTPGQIGVQIMPRMPSAALLRRKILRPWLHRWVKKLNASRPDIWQTESAPTRGQSGAPSTKEVVFTWSRTSLPGRDRNPRDDYVGASALAKMYTFIRPRNITLLINVEVLLTEISGVIGLDRYWMDGNPDGFWMDWIATVGAIGWIGLIFSNPVESNNLKWCAANTSTAPMRPEMLLSGRADLTPTLTPNVKGSLAANRR